MKLKMLFTSTFLSLGLIGSAFSEPAIIYDLGGKFDKSFNVISSEFCFVKNVSYIRKRCIIYAIYKYLHN